jgi:hypothetical protein
MITLISNIRYQRMNLGKKYADIIHTDNKKNTAI